MTRLVTRRVLTPGVLAAALALPGCDGGGPRVEATRYVGNATLLNQTTGALVMVRSDQPIFDGPQRPDLFTCRGAGPADLAARNWARYLRFAIEDPAAPEGARALLAGGPWCLTTDGISRTSEASVAPDTCVERSAPEPLLLCSYAPLACNVGIPAPPGTPSLSLDMPSLDFGSVPVGSPSAERTLTLANSGGGLLCLGAPAVYGASAGDFSLDASDCAPRPGDPAGTAVLSSVTRTSCTVRLRFTPGAPGARSAQLRVTSSARPGLSVELQGSGQPGTLAPAPASVCFNVAPVVEPIFGACYRRTLILTNLGPGRVRIDSVALPASAMGDWSIVEYAPLPPSLFRNTGQMLAVTLRTCRAGAGATVVTVNSNATNGPFDVPLLGPASGCTP